MPIERPLHDWGEHVKLNRCVTWICDRPAGMPLVLKVDDPLKPGGDEPVNERPECLHVGVPCLDELFVSWARDRGAIEVPPESKPPQRSFLPELARRYRRWQRDRRADQNDDFAVTLIVDESAPRELGGSNRVRGCASEPAIIAVLRWKKDFRKRR
jgi:hypothetical protein